ncbi:hypothetical protein IB211_00602c [Intestinimonas butyriciproducens]|uniref:Uncharacterized protein n=1 Tax=Intestinimonas butyriciproducens TaxID=1297617 RepID=A0A0S2W0W6_9FIRM|nr:hypothetical protein IB211_00602c [Intestinimonas butyriciproducens]
MVGILAAFSRLRLPWARVSRLRRGQFSQNIQKFQGFVL